MTQVFQVSSLRAAFSRLEWQRGARAGISVGTAMLFCLLLHRPFGWIALGALYICLVDNGGPYRSRLGNMLTIAVLGSFAVVLGSIANPNLLVGLIVTSAFFFSMTLARVLSQPLAATSVLILICYIVSFGGEHIGLASAAIDAACFFAGGIWAAAIALALWPVDPFRPAREAIADVYNALSQLSSSLSLTPEVFNEGLALTRIRIETAEAALAATPARIAVRTIRARNLTVLNECADLLMARILRFAELAETSASTEALQPIQSWLTAQLQHIEAALQQRPVNIAAFGPDGSLSIDMHHQEARLEAPLKINTSEASTYLITTLRDTRFNFDLAYEALRAVWTGAESRQSEAADFRASLRGESRALSSPATWLETLRSNLTLRSVMFRHALRLSAVISIDIFLTRYIHVTHSYWFAMTSLIVLRPFAGETVRRSFDRVAGTVVGGILAAGFTAIITNQAELLVLVVICSAGCVAFYAIDYAWYCFFVTPAIVLLTLPRLHDWHLAAIRTEMTVLGALISVLAMLLLWPQRESLELPGLLSRAAAADADYIRAMLAFWKRSSTSASDRIAAERALLAPARRLCGLAVNDAEETLDHALVEHSIPLNPRREPTKLLNSASLTFTTYLRRVTRTVTTLAAIGNDDLDPADTACIASLANRLDAVSSSLSTRTNLAPRAIEQDATATASTESLAANQLRRLNLQVSILERTAAELSTITPA